MNTDQGGGVLERVIYGAILVLVMKYGAKFGLSADDAAWLAGGAVALAGGTYAFIHNRPTAVLNRASNTLPDNAHLVITTTAGATSMEKAEVHALADAANDKVIAKTSPTTGL